VVSFTLLPLYPWGNSLQYPLYWKLGGPQSQSGHCEEEKNLLPLQGVKSQLLGHPAHILVTIPTELSNKQRINKQDTEKLPYIQIYPYTAHKVSAYHIHLDYILFSINKSFFITIRITLHPQTK
jgi:hypothetical protein